MSLTSQSKNHNTLDYLLYLMAGTVILALGFSGLLWLLI